MKKLFLASVILMLGTLIGAGFGPYLSEIYGIGLPTDSNDSSESKVEKPLYWVAPMDQNYRKDAPGLSPMGMELIPVYAEEETGDDGVVNISPAVENKLGVRSSRVKRSKLIMPIKTVGSIQFDESKISHIHSRVDGWIEKLYVSAAGDPVKKGQTLYELYSPDLVNAQEEYLAALRSGNKNLIHASTSRLFSLGLDKQQAARLRKNRRVDQRVKVIASQDGVVIDLKVRQGMHIKPSTEVLSIGSLDSVWIIAEIFERQSYLVKPGLDVEIELNAMPGKSWRGIVNHVYPQLNPNTRTLPVRIRLANLDHALKPNMLANLSIQAVAQTERLTIPLQALIKAGNHTRVVKALGDGEFKSVIVDTGFEGFDIDGEERLIQVISGLSEGDNVVTSGQFLIDSESNIDAEIKRLEQQKVQMDDKPAIQGSLYSSSGIITAVSPNTNMISLSHEAIPALNWGKMDMPFPVNKSIMLEHFSVGQHVNFEFSVSANHNYQIEQISERHDLGGQHD